MPSKYEKALTGVTKSMQSKMRSNKVKTGMNSVVGTTGKAVPPAQKRVSAPPSGGGYGEKKLNFAGAVKRGADAVGKMMAPSRQPVGVRKPPKAQLAEAAKGAGALMHGMMGGPQKPPPIPPTRRTLTRRKAI